MTGYPFDPRSSKTRELLARLADERRRNERAALQHEHDPSGEDLWFIGWEGLPTATRRRTVRPSPSAWKP